MLCDGRYAILDKILVSSKNELMCLVIPMRIAGDLIPSVKRCAHDCYDTSQLVDFKDISKKCVIISFENKTFICDLPNTYERD